KVWAMFQETDRKFQTVAQQMRESSEKTERFMQKLSAETNRKMQETNEQLGRLDNRFGELAEHLVAPGIFGEIQRLGVCFYQMQP
ncbi:MAG: hypothetical protein LBS00_01475, partial [Synergistaceae bacterium]|nr:hypothetical protein [Synergistaceae bacterium]